MIVAFMDQSPAAAAWAWRGGCATRARNARTEKNRVGRKRVIMAISPLSTVAYKERGVRRRRVTNKGYYTTPSTEFLKG